MRRLTQVGCCFLRSGSETAVDSEGRLLLVGTGMRLFERGIRHFVADRIN